MATAGVQIGWIPYLNLHPMHQELMRIAGGQISLSTGHPTTVNRWLCDGTVGIAPCSSINLLRGENLDIALPMGIASEGPVLSVYLGAHREHASILEFIKRRQATLGEIFRQALQTHQGDMRRAAQKVLAQTALLPPPQGVQFPSVLFTPASAASSTLAKILLRMWFGEALSAQMCRNDSTTPNSNSFITGNRPLELVIGDEALARRSEFVNLIDLGESWWDLTGLPFVFAVWQSSTQLVSAGIRTLLSEAASLSSARMKVEPQVYYPDQHPLDRSGNPLDLASYWRVIQYKLTPRHLQGLLLYLSLYSELNANCANGTIPLRMAKWAGQWGTHVGS